MRSGFSWFRAAWICVILAGLISVRTAVAAGDPVMGAYEGTWKTSDGDAAKVRAQLRSVGGQKYDGFILLERQEQLFAAIRVEAIPGPGGRWNLTGKTQASASGGELQSAITFKGSVGEGRLEGGYAGEAGEGRIEGERVTRVPSALGAKPPEGAVVLFDGRNTEKWGKHTWQVTPEGSLKVGKGDIRTEEKLESFRLHLEFRVPFMPTAMGQARGNSGVYLQQSFEVQVLDSFGLFPLKDNDCSSIYSIKTASQNACLPPMEWQVYEITYLKGDADRKEGPMITVVHNGVMVIDSVRVPWEVVEKGTPSGDHPSKSTGMLKLQDHGTAVEYRNIWAVPVGRR